MTIYCVYHVLYALLTMDGYRIQDTGHVDAEV